MEHHRQSVQVYREDELFGNLDDIAADFGVARIGLVQVAQSREAVGRTGSGWDGSRNAFGGCIGPVLAMVFACCAATAAADNLYRAQTIVTGQGEANRTIGFAACLEDVLIKVSGALQLAGNSRLAPYKAKAGDFVKAYDYHDQMSGKPKRDEQGTRDRPYDLLVDFDKQDRRCGGRLA